MNKIINRRGMIAALVLTASALTAVMLNREECAQGIILGMNLCAEALLPSILPFMIIASFSVRSGSCALLGRLLDKPGNLLFKISGESLAVVLIGLLGGYPVTAKGIGALYKDGSISENEARKISCAAVCAGPGFLVSFVGARLMNSAELGAALISAQIISVVILLLVNRFIFPAKDEFNPHKTTINVKLSTALIESVSDASYAAIEMCAMVVSFSAINSVINIPFLSVILEVTNACNILCKNNNILLLAFAIGFGGLSVHFQIFQALRDIELNTNLFFLYRIIQGLLTAGAAYIFIKSFGLSAPVFSSISAQPEIGLSTSVTGGILLILTGLSLIYNIHKRGD